MRLSDLPLQLRIEAGIKQCVGCGYCCLESPCALSMGIYGLRDKCPALFWNGEKYRCKLAEEFNSRLYIGDGCCSPLNTWRQDVKRREEKDHGM